MNKYFIECTDTFGGMANYSWVRRYIVSAKTERGAMRKIASGWRKNYDGCYLSKSGLTIYFVEWIDDEEEVEIKSRYNVEEI